MDINSEEPNEEHSNGGPGMVWLPMGFETIMDVENQVQSCASNIAAGLQVQNLKPEEPQSSGQIILANIKQEIYDVKDKSFVDESKISESPAKGNCEAKEVYDVKDESFVDEAKIPESPTKGNCEVTWKWRPNMYKEIMPILDSEEKSKIESDTLEKASKTQSFQKKIETTSWNSTLEEELFGPLSPFTEDSDEDSDSKMGQEEANTLNHIDFEDLDVKPTLSDFDIMWKQSNASRKRAATLPFSHYASKVDKFIQKMRVAAEADRELNKRKEPAYKKMKLLKQFMEMLNNKNLKHLFYEFDVYDVLVEWLDPLPSGAWPCFHMRHSILQAMHLLPTIDLVTLKGHQIAKKVVFYWKHPNEERENRELAKQLIHKWARSYYSIPDDIGSMSVQERRERDVFIKTKLIVGLKQYKDIEKSFDFNRFAELHTPVDTGEPANSQKSSAIGDVINLEDCTDIAEAVELGVFEDGVSIFSVKTSNCDKSSIFGDGASLAKSIALSPFVEPSTGSETPSHPEKASHKRRVKHNARDDPGSRARVPEPSTKAYFIRPQSQVTTPFSDKPKKKARRFNNRLVL